MKNLIEIAFLLATSVSTLAAWSCLVLGGCADERMAKLNRRDFTREEIDSPFAISTTTNTSEEIT